MFHITSVGEHLFSYVQVLANERQGLDLDLGVVGGSATYRPVHVFGDISIETSAQRTTQVGVLAEVPAFFLSF